MQHRVVACGLFAFFSASVLPAAAATLPDVKSGPSNAVPECATPGRMLAYLKSRNPSLDQRYEGLPSHYMRIGEQLGVRWDFAIYQMILETGTLSYKRGNRSGDVKPTQNNFAGLGATGGGEPGESFKDIATGVRAHLEHLLLYSGEKLENPTAERTRKVQEWGVLTKWQARFNRPITFADLAAQWAPGTNTYSRMLDGIAERFAEFCEQPDPRPELLAEIRRDQRIAASRAQAPSGTELARRALETGRTEGEGRSSLGIAQSPPSSQATLGQSLAFTPPPATGQPAAQPATLPSAKAPPVGFKVLNAPKEPDALAADQPLGAAPAVETAGLKARDAAAKVPAAATGVTPAASKMSSTPEKQQTFQVASAAGAAKQAAPPPASGQKCRVWTASYGGQKALIIRSVIDKVVNYTVLDVNDGAEKREADAFIAAYAKDGNVAGEFGSQTQALDKAFELCPEG